MNIICVITLGLNPRCEVKTQGMIPYVARRGWKKNILGLIYLFDNYMIVK